VSGKRAKALRQAADDYMQRNRMRRFSTTMEIDHGPKVIGFIDPASGLVVRGTVDRITVIYTGWRRVYRNMKRDFKAARRRPTPARIKEAA